MTASIPFNRANLTDAERSYLSRAIEGNHYSGDGPFTKRCQSLLEEILGAPKVLLTTSCTHALEMSALLLDVRPGDEVIVPSFTFVTTVNAFVLRGAKPVFVDVRPDTLGLDERLLPDAITERTKCIVPVHYAGVACEMDEISAAAADSGATVVEDNAHGLFGSYRGRSLGTLGALATQSFHETKNITCGEGGALVINDPELVERAEIIREKGTDRSRFFRGQVDKYSWVDLGSSYVPSDLLAAILLAQLERRDEIQAQRRRVWEGYREGLCDWAEASSVRLPLIPPHSIQPYHLFYLLLPSQEDRTALIRRLRDKGIMAVFHYGPLHLSEMGRKWGGKPGDCPVTEDVADRLVRLPLFETLTDDDVGRIVAAVVEA